MTLSKLLLAQGGNACKCHLMTKISYRIVPLVLFTDADKEASSLRTQAIQTQLHFHPS